MLKHELINAAASEGWTYPTLAVNKYHNTVAYFTDIKQAQIIYAQAGHGYRSGQVTRAITPDNWQPITAEILTKVI
jgi:hypothetical protein